jgi:hypothetical protein
MIYGKDNKKLMEKVLRHPDFKDFVVPIERHDEIRDATFFLRNDGLLAFSEGYYHPPGRLIGNMIYIPDANGNKSFFGVPYASIIKRYGKEEDEWVTFKEQLEIYRRVDPSTQKGKPLFAENKCVFDIEDFIGHVPPRRSLQMVRERSPEIDRVIRNVAELFDVDPAMIGCTGSMAFGNIAEAHDFDLIFYGSAAEMRGIVSKIYELVKDPKRQVFEMGMLWAIRFYDDGGNMICPFFSYTNPEEIPLRGFELDLIQDDVEATVTIADDTHTGFMPTYLPLTETRIGGGTALRDPVLVIYHGGKRGEYRRGDRVKARGHLTRMKTPGRIFDAILVTDMDNTEKV